MKFDVVLALDVSGVHINGLAARLSVLSDAEARGDTAEACIADDARGYADVSTLENCDVDNTAVSRIRTAEDPDAGIIVDESPAITDAPLVAEAGRTVPPPAPTAGGGLSGCWNYHEKKLIADHIQPRNYHSGKLN